MKRSTAVGLTAAGGAIVSGAALFYSDGGHTQAPPSSASYSISVEATPREVDEGDLVEFLADVRAGDPAALDFPAYKWDFDDGSAPLEDVDLKLVNHRFVDGKDRLHRVTLRVEQAEHEVLVGVRNVPPSIHSMGRDGPALRRSPVRFEAMATDPGVQDILTYTWDFGDGKTATGRRARHTFEEDGRYEVRVTVDDGDGGTDTKTMDVIVGEGFRVTVGGEVSGQNQGRLAVAGVARNPRTRRASLAPEDCNVTLAMRPGPGRPGVPVITLTASLSSALRARRYTVGARSDIASWKDEHRARDVFFAGLTAVNGPGAASTNGTFASQSGVVSIEYIDASRIEGTFQIQMVEQAPYDFYPRQRTASASGYFAGVLEQRLGTLDYYACRGPEQTFDIAERKPKPDAQNADGRRPELSVTFTKPIDADSVARNVIVEYGQPAGEFEGVALPPISYHEVPGTWERAAGDEHSIRFVPQAHLHDAVIYCLRVRAGSQGIRGRDGEVLEPREPEYTDRTDPACANARRWRESREWAFSTLVEPESIRLDVYQVSKVAQDVPLVPGKPAVGRVYTIWTKRHTTTETGVNDWSQVKQFPARVTVEAGGRAVGVKRVTVSRPDQFSAEDRRQARNSVNVFGWRPAGAGGVDLRAVVEPIDEAGTPVRKFESARERVPYWQHSPVLSVDYYFVRVDGPCGGDVSVHQRPGPPGYIDTERATCADWRDGVPDGWRRLGHELMQAGAAFTTQTFPVIETQLRAMGDFHVWEPPVGDCKHDESGAARCYYPGVPLAEMTASGYVANALHNAAWASSADVIVGLVPPGFAPEWNGIMVPWKTPGKRVVLLELDEGDANTVAHELGHYYELNHCPPDCAMWTIRGFRISPGGGSGFNKQAAKPGAPGYALLEGNAEARELEPIMKADSNPYIRKAGGAPYPLGAVKERFQANHQYRLLLDAIASAPRRPAPGLLGAAGSSPGSRPRAEWPLTVARALMPLVHAASRVPQDAQAPDARLRVTGSLADTAATIERIDLVEIGTEPPASASVEGPFGLELVDSAGAPLARVPFAAIGADSWHGPPGGRQSFIVEIVGPRSAHGVRITANGKVLAERTRSAHAPDVRELTAQTEGGGGVRIAWQAADADGDALQFDVELRGAGDRTWRRAAVGITRTALLIDAQSLPPGPGGLVRIRATDGFNAASAEAPLPAQRPLTVLSASPGPDATDVSPRAEVFVQLSNPLRTATTGPIIPIRSGMLRLTDSEGREVLADVVYRRDASALIFTPAAPLRSGTRYTVTLAAGIEDRWGGTLAEPLIWSFVTDSAVRRAR